MAQEIFGPLLPLIAVDNLSCAVARIQKQDKPLAIYLFGGGDSEQNALLQNTSSGGVCFNDVVMQGVVPELPFGGVGLSGMGNYHGEAGFRPFSHERAVLRRPFFLDSRLRYPPYKLNPVLLRRLIR